jgi:hypothetical protein
VTTDDTTNPPDDVCYSKAMATPLPEVPDDFWTAGPSFAAFGYVDRSLRRYAQVIKGLDLDGTVCCLALTWGGDWHPINPVTGNRLIPIRDLHALAPFIYNGITFTRFSLGWAPGNPTTFRVEDNDDHTIHTIPCDAIVEVLP